MKSIYTLGFLIVTIVLSGFLCGCSDSDTVTDPPAGQGTMQVHLIDAPGDYDEVNIEVVEVQIHMSDVDSLSGWQTIAVDTTLVNLLELTGGNYAVLADSTLPAGHYTQIRLILGENNNVVVAGEVHDLSIPGSGQSGLKLNHPFDIYDGETYMVTLDFDADRSIHQTGNGQYKMIPVIRLVVNNLGGSISGVVEPVSARAMVMALADQDTVVAHADTLSGSFVFPMLTGGSYDLEFSATVGSFRDTTLTGVVVTAGQDSNLGTVVLEAD